MIYQKVGYPSQDGELYIKSSGLEEVGICTVDEEKRRITKCIWFDDIDKARKGISELHYTMRTKV